MTPSIPSPPDPDPGNPPPAGTTTTTPPPKPSRLGPRPAVFPSTLHELLFVLQATTALAMSSFFQGASSVLTASIGASLSMTQGEITWIAASTALTAGAFQLGLGQASDLLGRRAAFLLGTAAFSLTSVFVAFARDPYWMDVGCGVVGVAAAAVVAAAVGIMGAAYEVPGRRKNLVFGAFGAGNPLGFVFGSILSGVVTRVFGGWRAAFVMIGVVWAVFAVAGWWTVPKVEAYAEGERLGVRWGVFVKRFDVVGTVLTVFGAGLVTAGVTLGPTDGWKSAHVIAMLVLGVVLLVVFVFWERVYEYPLMPPRIWRDRNFTLIILSCVPGYMGFLSSNFWLAFFMQELQGLPPLTVAVRLVPQAVAGLVYNVIAGSVLHRVNNTLLLVIGSLSYIGSSVLLAIMKPDSPYWAFVFPSLILSVVGADFQFNVANMYVMQSLPSHQQALAGGIFNTIFRLAAAISLGISTAVYTSFAGKTEVLEDPMLPYAKAFQVCIGLGAASFLFLPFVRLGTQGHSKLVDVKDDGAREPVLGESVEMKGR